MQDFPISRRLMLAGAGATALAGCATMSTGGGESAAAPIPVNPVVQQRADAQVFRHTDGNYFMMASVPEYDRLIIRKSRTIAGLADPASEAVIWRRPTSGKMGGHIWAPELHDIDGVWHCYFSAGDSGDRFHIRTYVMRCKGKDAQHDPWEMVGQLEAPYDTFNLDSSIFTHKGQRYLMWAQTVPGVSGTSVFLAPLATPLTFAKTPLRLTIPTFDWEIQKYRVNEAPAMLHRNGRLFMAYSASATDDRYCLGLMTADENADLMDLNSWTKSPVPVFVSSPETGVYGPGHNSFTVDEQGRDLLVYHGRDYKEITGDSLYDPNRHTRVQRLYYKADGSPDFGIPVGNGEVPDRFSPADMRGAFLRHDGDRIIVGGGDIPTSQFRVKPGLAGAGTVSLEPILARGKVLRRMPDGSVVVGSLDGDPQAASFVRRGGTFVAVGTEGVLHHVGGNVRVGPARGGAASFIVS